MNFEYQTTDVIECSPEDLDNKLMQVSNGYLIKERKRMDTLLPSDKGEQPPMVKAHQILILP